MNEITIVVIAVVYPKDLGVLLSAGIYITAMQLLLWIIARHSADIDFWRTCLYCLLVGAIMAFGVVAGNIGALAVAFAMALFCGWVLLGYVFELEVWQRAVVASVGPVAAVLSIFLGFALKKMFVSGMLA
jgi:hypothetical protein